MVIGRTGPSIKNKLQEMHQIRGRAIQKAREAMKNARGTISEAHDDVIRALDDKIWDVTEDWHVSCLEMERRWSTPLTLKIYSQGSDGQCQLFGEFDFGRVSGLFRFEQQSPTTEIKPARLAHPNVKRGKITFRKAEKEKKGANEDEDDDSDNNIEYRRTKTKPWIYRWRGEYEIDSEPVPGQYLCPITFGEPLGTTLTGTFGGDLHRTWKEDMVSTGIEVGVGGAPPIDIEKEWRDGQNIIYDSDIQD